MNPLSPSAVKYKLSRSAPVSTAVAESAILYALYDGGMTRDELFAAAGISATMFKTAMRDLCAKEKIWKVGKVYELRTETAVL